MSDQKWDVWALAKVCALPTAILVFLPVSVCSYVACFVRMFSQKLLNGINGTDPMNFWCRSV